jgi:hypothetical protein
MNSDPEAAQRHQIQQTLSGFSERSNENAVSVNAGKNANFAER